MHPKDIRHATCCRRSAPARLGLAPATCPASQRRDGPRRRRRREGSPCSAAPPRFSGGVLWIPGNPHAKAQRHQPTRREAVRTYMAHQTGAHSTTMRRSTAFLDNGPRMVEFFERETEVNSCRRCTPTTIPTRPAAWTWAARSLAAPYDARALGKDMARLRPPLTTITFIGMMFNSSNADLKHFFNATKSLASASMWQAAGDAPEGSGASTGAACRSPAATRSRRGSPSRPSTSAFRSTPTPRREELMTRGTGRVTGAWCAAARPSSASPRAARRGAGVRRLSARRRAHRQGLPASGSAAASICSPTPAATPATA